MHVEDLFRLIDNVLGLSKLSNVTVLLISSVLVFTATLSVLHMAIRRHANENTSGKANVGIKSFSMAYICVILLMASGLACSLDEHNVNMLLVLSLSIYVLVLMWTCFCFRGQRKFLFFLLFYISVLLFASFFSGKVLLNGVEAAETTVDTLQIYAQGCFQFSRHAGWYDLAPVDAIMKTSMLYVLGIDNPYDPAVTTLIFNALSISVLVFLFAFVRRLHCNSIGNYALAIMLLSINPYSILIGMSTPPTNFSLTLSMLAILLASRRIYGPRGLTAANLTSSVVGFAILTISAVLAHPMSVMIPTYMLATSTFLAASHSEDVHTRTFHNLTLVTIIIFLSKLIFTGVSAGFLSLIDAIMEGLTTLLFGEAPKDIAVYFGGPPPPKSTLFSFAAFPSFVAAIFFVEIVRILKGRNGDKLTMLVLGTVLVFAVAAATTNIATPSSRYLGYPAIVLGSYQSMIFLANLRADRKWKSILVVLLGIMCLSSILSPNAMVEQYKVFTGGRWPRLENFILSRFLIDHVSPEYVVSVFNGWQKARLNLYFTHDILYYGHPYHHIEVLLTEKFLIPKVIDARSYWDFSGRLFVNYAGYTNSINATTEDVVFSGWRWVMTWK